MVIMDDVDLCLKIPATLTFTIMEKLLMLMGKVDIGLIPFPLPYIIQVDLGILFFFCSWSLEKLT